MGTKVSKNDHFNINIQYQTSQDDWIDICTRDEDIGVATVNSSDLLPGNYNFRLTIYNRFYPWLLDERTVTGVVIHHIGPPEFDSVLCPGRSGYVAGDITIEWKVVDDPSEEVMVHLYHRNTHEDWRYVVTREGRRGSFIWNSSEEYSGTYQFKLVALELDEY